MKQFFKKNKKSIVILLIVLAVAGYFIFGRGDQKTEEISYETAAVEKGMIISSVSGSGQVSALDQIDVKAKASGEIIFLDLKKGSEVKKGTLIAKIDDKDALQSVRDAAISLESANISFEKLIKPADELSLLQAENALINAREAKTSNENQLKESYEDGFNEVASAFLNLPQIVTGLQEIVAGSNSYIIQSSSSYLDYYYNQTKGYDFDKAWQYRDDVLSDYGLAKAKYDQNSYDYKSTTRFSSESDIEKLIVQTYETAKAVAETVKSANSALQLYKDKLTENNQAVQGFAETHLTNLSSYSSKINGDLTGLLSAKQNIQNNKDSVIDAQRNIEEKEKALADLKAGADPLDIRSQELSLQQKKNALNDAKEKLADYSVYSPMDGIVAELTAEQGDSISSGGAIATLITKQHIAEITLNEVDIAQVKNGQKANMTFDAIEDLNITGTVSEVDALGTVSQGVVSYGVKIVFDAQDDRIKPGMSLSASIITASKTDALLVSNSAIKSSQSGSYVELLNQAGGTPSQQAVETGLTNDSVTEILSGLEEGDMVVVKTSGTNGSQNNQTSRNSIFQTGGGGIRIPR